MRWIWLAMLVGCTPVLGPKQPPPVVEVGSDDCETDCRYWRALSCSEGAPTTAGTSCEAVCRNAAENGIDTAKQLSCAAKATSCADHRACPY